MGTRLNWAGVVAVLTLAGGFAVFRGSADVSNKREGAPDLVHANEASFANPLDGPPGRPPDSIVSGDAAPEEADPSDCPTVDSPTQEESDDYRKHMVAISNRLASTNDAEFLLVAAMLRMNDDASTSKVLFNRADELDPANPLIAWNRLLSCSEYNDANCDFETIRADAISVDKENGAVWMAIATEYLKAGNDEMALNAIRRAGTASRFDEYWSEQIALFERGFAATTNWTYQERVSSAIGMAAALILPMPPILERCKVSVDDDAVWAELCDQLGQKMYEDGRTMLTRSLGLVMRESVYTVATSPVGSARVSELRSELRRDTKDLLRDRAVSNLMWNDERVLRSYLENMAAYGEIQAMTIVHEEAARLAADPDYDQCNFAGNPFGF